MIARSSSSEEADFAAARAAMIASSGGGGGAIAGSGGCSRAEFPRPHRGLCSRLGDGDCRNGRVRETVDRHLVQRDIHAGFDVKGQEVADGFRVSGGHGASLA